MAQTYSWRHPGARCLEAKWLLSTPLLPDEILSSWLSRSALHLGTTPLALAGAIWGNWRGLTVDTDRCAPVILSKLANEVNVNYGALMAATLRPTACRIAGENLTNSVVWPWMLTIGARNLDRRGGMQYCPACLQTDAIPHFRLQWRFAWSVHCEKHRLRLLDTCPDCGLSVTFHKIPVTKEHIASCNRCGADFRHAVSTAISLPASRFQKLANQCAGDLPGEPTATSEWFKTATFFVQLIRRAQRAPNSSLMSFVKLADARPPVNVPSRFGEPFEHLHTIDREHLLRAVEPLITSQSDQLYEWLLEAEVSKQAMLGDTPVDSIFIEALADKLPDRSRPTYARRHRRQTTPRPPNEVHSMMARLMRRSPGRKQ